MLAVFLTALASWAVLQYLVRSSAQERADTLAAVLAANAPSVASLKDKERADELLAIAASTQGVIRAQVLDSAGVALSTFARSGQKEESSLSANTSARTASKPIVYLGETLGSVDVTVESAVVASVPALFVLAALGVAVLLLGAIWALALPLEKRISKPLLSLSVFTRRIRDTKDYSMRVPPSPVKEMRGLVDDVNAMLGEIEKTSRAQQDRSSELSKLAFYDQLTGAANRSLFRDRLGLCVSNFNTHHQSFAVIGIDLDHFKQLNDTLGHQIGDNFLREVATNCIRVLRPNDTFARMGGDEFTVLLPNVDKYEDALAIAEKMRAAVASGNNVHQGTVKCSASIGVGLYPTDAANASDLMGKVDAAMYRAKSAGRNRVVPVSITGTKTAHPKPPEIKLYR